MIYQSTLGGPRAPNVTFPVGGSMSAVGLLGSQVRLRDALGAYFGCSLVVVEVFIAILSSFFTFLDYLGEIVKG